MKHAHEGDFFLSILMGAVLAMGMWWGIVSFLHVSPSAIEDLRCRIERLEGTPIPDGALRGVECPPPESMAVYDGTPVTEVLR